MSRLEQVLMVLLLQLNCLDEAPTGEKRTLLGREQDRTQRGVITDRTLRLDGTWALASSPYPILIPLLVKSGTATALAPASPNSGVRFGVHPRYGMGAEANCKIQT